MRERETKQDGGHDGRVYYSRDAKGNVYERRLKPTDLSPKGVRAQEARCLLCRQ